ncbi:MAG: cell division protein FtsZ [Elusimicrobiota bacterium]|jgi:cell division protein FtsZ|nr:cell division protein FtsZ [Elusimicrobiota bacterium]
MFENFFKDDFKQYPAIIKIIGIGGAGGNAINRMIDFNLQGVEFVAANTDAQALRTSKAGLKLQLGSKITKGLGVGGNPELGKKAAEEDIERLREILIGTDMIFITAGMGGGTGTGATPIIAKIAKELKILTVGIVTKPFTFEGKIRSLNADLGISNLREFLDTLIVIPNQKLFDVIDEKTTTISAWEKIDDVLRQSIQSISDIITSTGLVNVDFNDVKAIMSNAGDALMGMGEGSGDSRALKATEMAMNSPLLEDVSIKGARGVLVNITGGKDITMHEINDAMTLISNSISKEANIFFGQVVDEALEGKIKITIIATNFEKEYTKSKNSENKDTNNLYNKDDDSKDYPEIFDLKKQGKEQLDLNLEEPAFIRRNKKK